MLTDFFLTDRLWLAVAVSFNKLLTSAMSEFRPLIIQILKTANKLIRTFNINNPLFYRLQ